MNLLRVLFLMLVSATLVACVSSQSASVYSPQQARQEMTVRQGTVESVREVIMQGSKSGVGTLAGAAVGGVAGSNIGGGKGQIVGAILGAVAGGLAGSAIEEGATRKVAFEITVRLNGGQLVAVVQETDERFFPAVAIPASRISRQSATGGRPLRHFTLIGERTPAAGVHQDAFPGQVNPQQSVLWVLVARETGGRPLALQCVTLALPTQFDQIEVTGNPLNLDALAELTTINATGELHFQLLLLLAALAPLLASVGS